MLATPAVNTSRWQPYPAYRPSGVEWLGDIPAHWVNRKIKYVLRQMIDTEHKTASFYPDGEYLVVRTPNVRDGKLVFDDAKYTDYAGYREWTRRGTPEPGDILFTREAPAGEACLVPDNIPLCIGQRMVLFRVDRNKLDERFAIWALYGGIASEFIKLLSQGTTVAHFNMSDIANIPLLLPSVPEQRAIAAFLDRETTHLDALIAKKQRLIELLQEKRTALISQAVTKGLDPNVAMKDSGVTWAKHIPEHWTLFPLKRNWLVTDCKHRTVPFVDEGIPLASIGEVQSFDIDLSNAKRTTYEEYLQQIEGGRKPHRGDVIYSRNATVGAAAHVNTDEDFCMGQDVCLIRSREHNQRFLVYQLRSPFVMNQLDAQTVGATFKRINVGQIKEFLVCCPPHEEQNKIAAFLDVETSKIDRLIAKVNDAIERLREYRTTLIAAAVTGKIKVFNG